MQLIKRFQQSGLNLMVLFVSMAVFLGAFCALTGLANAQNPATLTILAAARSIAIGEVLGPADLVERTVYEDENSRLYIPADSAADVIGGVAALPIRAGQPIFRDNVIALAGNGFRLSAVLSEFPDYSLFPLPIDADNVTSPGVEAFLPGDLIGITVVIDRRPQPPVTPTPEAFSFTGPEVISTTIRLEPAADSPAADALERTGPPLAKDLFPQGVRVVVVEGQAEPVQTDPENPNASPVFSPGPQAETLIILVPNAAREELALAMQQGARIFVSLLAHSNPDGATPGFTYWDFEDLFAADRREYLEGGAPAPTATPAVP